jgi:hypothetical protein
MNNNRGDAKVLKTFNFKGPWEADQYLRSMGSSYVGKDLRTGAPVFKTAAGLHVRVSGNGSVAEVLSHCTC